MAYSNVESESKISFWGKLIKKTGKIIGQYFPLNSIRIWGLRICGFSIGSNVYVGSELLVISYISDNSCYLSIQDRVAIAPRVTIVLSSDANWSRLMNHFKYVYGQVIIENDAWIGTGVIILPNITIGQFSVVGAGSVVTQNVPPFKVVAGSPAKIIRELNPSDFISKTD